MSISVELKGVGRSFGGREVLKGINCAFPEGKISALIGPNGSGKTTMLRIAARLEVPGPGSVSYLKGRETVPEDTGLMRSMTLVSQEPLLFNTTLYNNIAYGLRLRGLTANTVKDRVEEALEAGGLSRLAHAHARTLSGGEAQRAAVVRAYALRPELVLMDEPTANLDPEGVALVEGLLRRMKEEHGTTAVVVTHNIFQAKRVSDQVFFLYGGELVETGDNPGFFANPQMELTRRFVTGEVVY